MKPGDKAPEFVLPDQNGEVHTLTGILTEGPVALFFYPAAFTPGCTKEACHFRDRAAEFSASGIQRIGISRDAPGKQRLWASENNLDYPLLADVDGTVAEAYGVSRVLLAKVGMPTKRTTFAIRADGTIADVISSELNMDVHADRALNALSS